MSAVGEVPLFTGVFSRNFDRLIDRADEPEPALSRGDRTRPGMNPKLPARTQLAAYPRPVSLDFSVSGCARRAPRPGSTGARVRRRAGASARARAATPRRAVRAGAAGRAWSRAR